jgi:hypothetical protein
LESTKNVLGDTISMQLDAPMTTEKSMVSAVATEQLISDSDGMRGNAASLPTLQRLSEPGSSA